MHIRVVRVKLNDSAKYVELSVECLRTRVRFPPSPPHYFGGQSDLPLAFTAFHRGLLTSGQLLRLVLDGLYWPPYCHSLVTAPLSWGLANDRLGNRHSPLFPFHALRWWPRSLDGCGWRSRMANRKALACRRIVRFSLPYRFSRRYVPIISIEARPCHTGGRRKTVSRIVEFALRTLTSQLAPCNQNKHY